MIRLIWIYATEKDLDILSAGEQQRNDILNGALERANDDKFELLLSFKNETHWSLLTEYKYFGE